MILKGRTLKGEDISLSFRDYSDLTPAYDKDYNRFRAFTSHYASSDGSMKIYMYSIVDAELAEKSGNVGKFRHEEDSEVLRRAGINPLSLVVVRESDFSSESPW